MHEVQAIKMLLRCKVRLKRERLVGASSCVVIYRKRRTDEADEAQAGSKALRMPPKAGDSGTKAPAGRSVVLRRLIAVGYCYCKVPPGHARVRYLATGYGTLVSIIVGTKYGYIHVKITTRDASTIRGR